MKMKRVISLGLSFALLTSSSLGTFIQPIQAKDEAFMAPYIEGEVIACIKGDVNSLNMRNRRSSFEITPLMDVSDEQKSTYSNDGNEQTETLVLIQSNQDTSSLIDELEELPMVEFAEPNYRVELYSDSPSDPDYGYQWGIENQQPEGVDANIVEAWESVDTSKDTPVVAVLDSGVDYNHLDLKNVMWDDGLKYPALVDMGGGKYGFNTSDGPEKTNDPMDSWIGHGTHCAGIIAAQWNNEEGTAGVSPNVEIMALKFLGGQDGNVANALKAYAYMQAAKESGVNLVAINNSWGTSDYDGIELNSIATATNALGKLGVVSCFAAGNSNTNNDLNVGSNSRSPYVVTVGALESTGQRASFSCYGQRTVDVFAPGTQILAPTTTDTKEVPLNAHLMVPQYLPQLMDSEQSYYYENFEDGDTSLRLRILNEDGEVIEDNQTMRDSGYMSEHAAQISLDAVAEGEAFYVEMQMPKSEFVGIEELNEDSKVYLAFQAGMGSQCAMNSMMISYKTEEGEWEDLMSTQIMEGQPVPARFRIADYQWNQSSQELDTLSFLQNDEDMITLRIEGKMSNKQPGVSFYLDDFGFGREAVPYYYADGTSMAAPMVTGIAALLSTKYDAAEICARIKGGVNREDANGIAEQSVSGGFIDAGAAFDDTKVVPVLNELAIDADQASVSGYFFGKEQGSITIDGVQATITSWNDHEITFLLPVQSSEMAEVKVTAKDGRYGRNFFAVPAHMKGYQNLSTPKLSYGDNYGYELTSADLFPVQMAAAGGNIFVLGMILETNEIVMEKYHIESDTWSKVALPDDLQALDMVSVYHLAGGVDKLYFSYVSTSGYSNLGVYDTRHDTWSSVETELSGGEALVVYQNQLLAIGGEEVNEDMTLKETYRKVQILDPYTGKFIGQLPELPEGRSCANVVASGDTLIVQGGYDSVLITLAGQASTVYDNTMVYDGNSWTYYEDDHFLSKENQEFDEKQTLDYAMGAVDGGAILNGPVQNLGDDNMVDTWSFDATTGTWKGNQNILYSDVKTTRNIGVSYDGQFYALAYTGQFDHLQIFRRTPVSYTSPDQDPTSDDAMTIPVIYRYEGNVIAQEEAVLLEGEQQVLATKNLAKKYGYVLSDSEADNQTVIVSRNSESGELEASSDAIYFDVIPCIDPQDYTFDVSYIDNEGNTIPGGTLAFDHVGPYSRENIPKPYGYRPVIPAHPSEEWLNPTSLEFMDGKWTVTNPKVVIAVEKMASVSIIFKNYNGDILEDLGYTKYYDHVSAGIEQVTAPEGYVLLGSNTFAVDITRNEKGQLVASPDEVIFWVKEKGVEIPVNPFDYSFEVKYVDQHGNLVAGGGTITFDQTGAYSREKIPMPYGYQAINLPAHPSEEWLNPTALEFIDGVWTVTNPIVTIEVERQASVAVIFQLEDGTILENGYVDYYGEIGAGLVAIHVPEGYELVSEYDCYAVEITRDAEGNLTSDITEAIFIVKMIETVEPVDPSGPNDSSSTETPSTPNDKNTPQTGDEHNVLLMTMLMLVSCGMVYTLIMKRRKNKNSNA